MENSVALNLSITRSSGAEIYFGRVTGYSGDNNQRDPKTTGGPNHARSDMVFIDENGDTAAFPNLAATADGKDGADVALGTALVTVFSGWDANIWNIPSGNLTVGGALPTLKAVTQSPAPTLPAIP